MLPTPTLVFGDVHLGIAPPAAEHDLLQLLRSRPGGARSVVIMGDLFDFWFAWRHVMPRTGFRVLAALADLTDAGIPVLWIGGNHDCWGGEVLAGETGARYTLEPWRGPIGPWDALLAHGDGLRPVEDARYRRLRGLLRHPLAIRAYGWLHPDWASALALASSATSRKGRAVDGGRGLLAVGTRQMQETEGLQLVVHGHSHVPLLTRAGPGVYANAGAWYLDRQYLLVEEERITRRQWGSHGTASVVEALPRPVRD